jgi:ABC-type transporter Mla subunit MlaD
MTIDERVEFLMQSIESHDRQIGELTDRIGQIGDTVDKLGDKVDKLADKVDKVTDAVATLVRVTNEDATAIRTLARIAEAHEQRIAGLEGKN